MIPKNTLGRTLAAALPGVVAMLTGCGDDFGPGNWDADIDTIALFAIERPELQGLPGAYDFVNERLRALEDLGSFGEWDIALDDADGGGLQLLTPGAIDGLEASSGIARVEDRSFESLEQAPGDTARYERNEPVPLVAGTVFVVRTRLDPRFASCLRYVKMELVESDPVNGTASLRYTRNPFCGDRALVPPDER
jgi:hypothetical protein